MNYSQEVKEMCFVRQGCNHGPAPIPEEGRWVLSRQISDISGLSHGIGWCAPQQGACKLAYGRTQTAFSEDGLPVGAGLEDLGKGLCSQVGTIYATREKGPRYLQLTEGYILSLALDANDEIIGYKFCHLGKMMAAIRKGEDPKAAYEKNISTYGRYADAAKYIDPRSE